MAGPNRSTRRRGGARGPAQQPAEPHPGETVEGGLIRGRHIDIGDLGGETAAPVLASFRWFGERFRVNPNLTETSVVDMFEAAQKVTVTDPKQFELSKDYVREHVHPDDFDRFWSLARAHRQGIADLMTLCWKILEQVAERPTTPPTDSAGGRPDIRQNSPAGASDRVVDGSVVPAPASDPAADWWPEGVPFNPVAAKYVDRFEAEGRPDKANFLMLAQESRAGVTPGA